MGLVTRHRAFAGIVVTRHCMRGGQSDSQELVTIRFLEREPFLTGYDSKFTKSRNPLERVLFLETPLWLTFWSHSDSPSYCTFWISMTHTAPLPLPHFVAIVWTQWINCDTHDSMESAPASTCRVIPLWISVRTCIYSLCLSGSACVCVALCVQCVHRLW